MLPGLAPSGVDSSSQSLHIRYLLAWYVASPDTFLPRGAFRLAWASHLRLPVFAPEQRCQYRPLSTGRACSAALGHHNVHVHTCAFGPRQRRHNSIRDVWMTLLKAAHWHADSDQLVRTGDDTYHRADITAASPDGTLWALDVSVTATPGPEHTVHEHLERSANAKASRYRPGGERRLPDGHTLVPLIQSADFGWLGIEALTFLQRLLVQLSAADAPPSVEEWQPHMATVTQYQLAKLSQSMHLANWQMHTACGRLL